LSADRLTLLPFWVSERAPTWPETLSGTISGLTQATTAADLLRATISAVSCRLEQILELSEGATKAKKIIVSAGVLRSPATLQILANALGRDLEVSRESEASLRGAAVYVP
jgi:sugar (pentulose or hexulose) kinase